MATIYIHDREIIHRDLKLSNIFIDENTGFGLAVRSSDICRDQNSICGTISYLAPEVVCKKGFGFVSDIWSIGVITFVLLFGYKPFKEWDAYETQLHILRADYK